MLKTAAFLSFGLAACTAAPAVSLALLAAGAGALLADRRC
jgi:hypothetical protein